jgi:CheY-like chemotaxis protein
MLRRVIGEDIELRIDLGQGVGRVNADPGQLEQVIMNLVVNARDAMPSGGILTIETKNVDLRADSGSSISVRPGLYVMLAVSDNGIGMSAETRAHLFEPFFTTKGTGRGTGLGLSTVFGIVRQSGGALDVYSEPGKGTSFKIFLPRLDRAADEPEATLAAPGRGSETILLVEDDDTVRKLVRETLESQGYLVLDAPGAADAQAIATRHDGPIPLLITDVVMPRLSGPELAKQLTAVRPDMKVLFISGYTDNAVVNNGVLTSSMAFLQKPFTPSAIARKVRQVLEKNGHRTGGAAH